MSVSSIDHEELTNRKIHWCPLYMYLSGLSNLGAGVLLHITVAVLADIGTGLS